MALEEEEVATAAAAAAGGGAEGGAKGQGEGEESQLLKRVASPNQSRPHWNQFDLHWFFYILQPSNQIRIEL